MIKTFFKESNIDFDRSKIYNTPNCIYVDGYFLPENEHYPICNSFDLKKNSKTLCILFFINYCYLSFSTLLL